MKLKIAYLLFLAAAAGLIVLLTSGTPSPDNLLRGTWQEESWEYEKVNQSEKMDSVSGREIAEHVKQLIAQNLVVHRAEQWRFRPDGTLHLLSDQNTTRQLSWKMKGRGHILVLRYDDRMEESYTIAELTDDRMVLHFYTEMQARGIAKITFTRTN